jgi:hypothetical protein
MQFLGGETTQLEPVLTKLFLLQCFSFYVTHFGTSESQCLLLSQSFTVPDSNCLATSHSAKLSKLMNCEKLALAILRLSAAVSISGCKLTGLKNMPLLYFASLR